VQLLVLFLLPAASLAMPPRHLFVEARFTIVRAPATLRCKLGSGGGGGEGL